MVYKIPKSFPAPIAVTLIGGASGIASYLTMMAIAHKIEGRVEITTKEIIISSFAVAAGSALAYWFVKEKEKEELPTNFSSF